VFLALGLASVSDAAEVQPADASGAEKVHLAGKTYGNRVMRTASADQPQRTLSVHTNDMPPYR
jgi:hypothetical protein